MCEASGDHYDTHYTLIVPPGFSEKYTQIIYNTGTDVFVDGTPVGRGRAIDEYEVVDISLGEGSHDLHSSVPFGINQFGWSTGRESECPLTKETSKCFTSYAHIGGLGPRP